MAAHMSVEGDMYAVVLALAGRSSAMRRHLCWPLENRRAHLPQMFRATSVVTMTRATFPKASASVALYTLWKIHSCRTAFLARSFSSAASETVTQAPSACAAKTVAWCASYGGPCSC